MKCHYLSCHHGGVNHRRLFTAVLPTLEATTQLEDFLEDTGIRRMSADAAWVKPHRWHITTCFMPKVEHVELDVLDQLLAELAQRTSSFRLRLAGAGVFLHHSRNLPMWVGVDGDVAALDRLVERSRTAVARAGIRHESGKTFTPHVTVARKADRVDTSLWVDRLNAFAGTPFEVSEFALVESVKSTKDKPPRYDVLSRYRLS